MMETTTPTALPPSPLPSAAAAPPPPPPTEETHQTQQTKKENEEQKQKQEAIHTHPLKPSSPSSPSQPTAPAGAGKLLCLTIYGYRKPGMSPAAYREHMVHVSAPLTKDLMVKYGVVRWTQTHHQPATTALLDVLFDHQLSRPADFDCLSQVVFRDLEGYRRMKEDPWYKEHLVGDHEKFADTRRSMVSLGWIEQYIDGGAVVDGFDA